MAELPSGSRAQTRRASPPVALGRRALFVSAGMVTHTLWASAAPAMTYRLFADEWHLNHTVTTGIFAIYPVVVALTLICFGDISDHIGPRATMLAGLGTLLFTVAPDVLWLFAGRVLMGVGVGLTAAPSTAAVVEFASAGPAGNSSQRAALIATVAQAAGFAAALLLGGALIAYAPWPTRLSFCVLALLLALPLVATWFLPRHRTTGASMVRRVRLPFVPSEMSKEFATASVAIMTAYTHGVLILWLGGQVAHDLIGPSNALVNGAVLSLFAIVSGAVGPVARPVTARTAMTLGAVASATGMGLLALAVALHDLHAFLLANAISGAGYSLLFLSALQVINTAAPAQQRGGVLSALYLLAYLSMGVIAVTLGIVATDWGLRLAIELGAGVIALLSLSALALASAMRPSACRPFRLAPNCACM
jgi:MFS family permease